MDQRMWAEEDVVPRRWASGKPRVLIEDASGSAAISDHTLFRKAGFDVAVCSGPDGSATCPLVESGRCELAETADVVLFGPDVDDRWRDVLLAHLRWHPVTPVVVLRRGDEAPLDDETATRCTILPATASIAGQTRALRRAVSATDRR